MSAILKPKKKPFIVPKKTDNIIFDFTEEELIEGLNDTMWRLNNLYRIINENKEVVPFRLKPVQVDLLDNMHFRNCIIKSRKHGISSAVQMKMLDTALFSPNERCRVIAQDLGISQAIFRDVLKFAYDGLPAPLKEVLPTSGDPSKETIEFKNGSIVEVSTNSRGTTPTFLHISEFGKISARDIGKAKEIVTGSITSVAKKGIIFVESTAEGAEGPFYEMVMRSQAIQDSRKPLYYFDFKLFFYPWFHDTRNVARPGAAVITELDNEYFDSVEAKTGTRLSLAQRTWYVSFRENTYFSDKQLMYQEQPSTVEEAFAQIVEGSYFVEQFRKVRRENRITSVPHNPQHAVSVFFDIGQGDACAMWAIEPRGASFAVVNFYECSGETLSHFAQKIDSWGYPIGYVFLPHDANHRRQGGDRNLTPEEMFNDVAPHLRTQIVPKTPDKIMAINQARNFLNMCIFDEVNCAQGLKHLQAYRKEKNERTGTYRNTPHHGPESNAADAFLQAAQAHANGMFTMYSGDLGNSWGNFGYGAYLEPPNLDF